MGDEKETSKEEKTEIFATFLALCLKDWAYFRKAVLMFFILLIGLVGAIYFSVEILDISGLKITSDGAELTIRSKNNEQKFETILVHPRGWVDTGIYLRTGDKVVISAYGTVNISFGEMVTSSLAEDSVRIRTENKIEEYTQSDIDAITYKYPWVSPDGLNKKIGTPSVRIHPESNLGQLLAVICPDGSCGSMHNPSKPSQEAQIEPYSKGSNGFEFDVKNDGNLRFIVNDVTNDDESRNLLGWQDNIGFYSVSIRVISTK